MSNVTLWDTSHRRKLSRNGVYIWQCQCAVEPGQSESYPGLAVNTAPQEATDPDEVDLYTSTFFALTPEGRVYAAELAEQLARHRMAVVWPHMATHVAVQHGVEHQISFIAEASHTIGGLNAR
jgi:hypothetical protein